MDQGKAPAAQRFRQRGAAGAALAQARPPNRRRSAQALLKVAAEAAAGGDVKSIPAASQVLDRFDRYQKAQFHLKDGEEFRNRLLAKLNRMAEAMDGEYGPLA